MEGDLVADVRNPALKQPQPLQRIDRVHGALERQVGVEALEQLDRLVDDEAELLRSEPVHAGEEIAESFAARQRDLHAVVRGGDQVLQASAVGSRLLCHGCAPTVMQIVGAYCCASPPSRYCGGVILFLQLSAYKFYATNGYMSKEKCLFGSRPNVA